MVRKAAKNNKKTVESSGKHKGKSTQTTDKQSVDHKSTSTSPSTPVKIVLNDIHSKNQQADFFDKLVTNKIDLSLSKNQFPFNLESEIAKIKIFVPLTVLVTQYVYKCQVLKALNIEENNDSFNLNEDQPTLLFGRKIEGKF